MESKIAGVKLVSIDLFRTLVDLDQTPKIIWETFLKDHFTPDVARLHWLRAAEILDRIWDDAGAGNAQFRNVKEVLKETCKDLFEEIQCDVDLASAVAALMQKHRIESLFDDARPFLETAARSFPVCLSTDCDLEMLAGIDKLFAFQNIFDSESLKSYKLNPAFFQQIIRHYGLKPGEILHIGDSKSDIITPSKLGIRTCWLNRTGQPWIHTVKPDFEARSLLQVLDLLGLNR